MEEQVPGSAITGGITRSSDHKTTFNWNKGFLNFSDGANDRAQMGNLDGTGKYGIRIKDSKGNVRLEVSDILQQFTMYDDSNNKIIEIDVDGFHGYDTLANELIKIDSDGLHGYDTSANELIKVDGDGLHGYDTSANELTKVDSEGFHAYKTDGTLQIEITGTGSAGYGTTGSSWTFRDEEGGTLYGLMGYNESNNSMYIASDNEANIYMFADNDLYLAADLNQSGSGDVTIAAITGNIYLTPLENLFIYDGAATQTGWSGTFADLNGNTLTVTKGLITNFA